MFDKKKSNGIITAAPKHYSNALKVCVTSSKFIDSTFSQSFAASLLSSSVILYQQSSGKRRIGKLASVPVPK